jgi:hypothetical protein
MPGRRTARRSARRSARRVSRKVSRRSAKKSGRVTRGSDRRSARRVSRRVRKNTRRNTRRNVRRVRRSLRRMRGGMTDIQNPAAIQAEKEAVDVFSGPEPLRGVRSWLGDWALTDKQRGEKYKNIELLDMVMPDDPIMKIISENFDVTFEHVAPPNPRGVNESFRKWNEDIKKMLGNIFKSREYNDIIQLTSDEEKLKKFSITTDAQEEFIELFKEVGKILLSPNDQQEKPTPNNNLETNIFYIDCGINDNDDAVSVLCMLHKLNKQNKNRNIKIYDIGKAEGLEVLFNKIFYSRSEQTGTLTYIQRNSEGVQNDIQTLIRTWNEVPKVIIYVLAPQLDDYFGGYDNFYLLINEFYNRSKPEDKIYFSGENQFMAIKDIDNEKNYEEYYKMGGGDGMEDLKTLIRNEKPNITEENIDSMALFLLNLCNSAMSTGLGIQSNTRGGKKLLSITHPPQGDKQVRLPRTDRGEYDTLKPQKIIDGLSNKTVILDITQRGLVGIENFKESIYNLCKILFLFLEKEKNNEKAKVYFIGEHRPKHDKSTLELLNDLKEKGIDLIMGKPISTEKGVADAVILSLPL